MDLAPTLLNLAGIPTEGLYLMGDDLLSERDPLVVFRYGSFTDGERFYKNSLDGIFENGTCYDVASGQGVAVEECRTEYERARERLRVSDNVIYGNLLLEFRANP